MLLQFSVANFKSIGPEVSLDLSASGISELAHHQVVLGNERILPTATIMGANNSGKSSIYEAFCYMRNAVLNSFHYGGDALPGGWISYEAPVGCVFSDHDEPTSFEVFVVDNHTYRVFSYGFSLDVDGVIEEWLNVKAKSARSSRRVFYRNRKGDGDTFMGLSAAEQKYLTKAIRPQMLLLSLCGMLNINVCIEMYRWFLDSVAISQDTLSEFHSLPGEKEQGQLLEFLSAFDETIIGVDIERQNEGEVSPRITVIHQIFESRTPVRFPLQCEGKGLQKLVALFPYIQKALHQGSLLIVDDLDAHLHPLAVRLLLLLFADSVSNPLHAQLVFTCHQSWHLSSGSLRRDEIWFVQKMENGVSSLYSLADFKDEDGTKVRKDELWQKNYLVGKYGAIPKLRIPSSIARDDVADGEGPYDKE